ncbi:MAG: hypothetical protein HY288_12080 [Planctomycetia bacterium]|nr:hypothetical protein [Planctomycetia bacterium]
MSGTFNGYHVWLGIPPNEQPPNHYRLLGIAAFEVDLDVIEHAADRQMAHVRTFQSGQHRALSQQILNELAGARLCLLNPEKKTLYDQELRAKIDEAVKGAAVPLGKVVPVAKPVAKAVPLAKPVAKPQARQLSPEVPDEIALDLASFPSSSSGGPPFQIHVKRRKYNQASAGKNAAILGALMATVVISGIFLYYFVRNLDWKQLLGTPSSATASQSEVIARPAPNPTAPPPPAPNAGQP